MTVDNNDIVSLKINNIEVDRQKYPYLAEYANPIKPFTGTLVGKQSAIDSLLATYDDPIVSNAVLLAPPGTGKTTLMKGMAHLDTKRVYIEAELSEMIKGLRDNAEMGYVVKNLFEEIANFGNDNKLEIVVFVDEFHQLVDYSPVVAEAFKPILAESGSKGLRLIVATTYEEFRQKIIPNQALTERLQRVSLPQPRYQDVMMALESLAKEQRILVDKKMKFLFHKIYHITEEFMPSANQPRKSILTFSRMIGFHRAHNVLMDMNLLAYVLRSSHNIEIDMKVNLDEMESYMKSKVLDQDKAVDSFMESVAMSMLRMNPANKPRGSWLLLGPTAVGKTEFVKSASKFLFADPNAFIRFDMTEYVNDDSIDRFRKLLTARIWEYPFSILLFDEIEKASGAVVRLLMQVLDDGRLTDENDRVVNFSNCYIFGTSNLGSEIFEQVSQYGSSSRSYETNVRKSVMQTSNGGFPPEVLNRFGVTIPFNVLSQDTMIHLLHLKCAEVVDKFKKEHDIVLNIDDNVLNDYLGQDVLKTGTEEGGGRQVNKVLRTYITQPVATYVCKHPNIRSLHLKIEGQLVTGNKGVLDGSARIVIEPN